MLNKNYIKVYFWKIYVIFGVISKCFCNFGLFAIFYDFLWFWGLLRLLSDLNEFSAIFWTILRIFMFRFLEEQTVYVKQHINEPLLNLKIQITQNPRYGQNGSTTATFPFITSDKVLQYLFLRGQLFLSYSYQNS